MPDMWLVVVAVVFGALVLAWITRYLVEDTNLPTFAVVVIWLVMTVVYIFGVDLGLTWLDPNYSVRDMLHATGWPQ